MSSNDKPASPTSVSEPAMKKQRRDEARQEYESAVSAAAAARAAALADPSAPPIPLAPSVLTTRAISLFMTGLPYGVVGLRKQLKERLSKYNLKSCRVVANSFNHTRAFGHLAVRDEESAQRLISEQDGIFRFDGAASSHPPLRITRILGKLDVLFPFVPLEFRAQIRMDDTALFSVTDQEHAQRITQILLCLLSIGSRDPLTPVKNTLTVSARVNYRWDAEQVMKENTAQQQQSLPTSSSSDNMGTASSEEQEAKEDAAEKMEIEQEEQQLQQQQEQQQQLQASGALGASGRIYSADVEINRLATDILENSNWSIWTDYYPPSTSAVDEAHKPLKTASSPYTITDGCACSGGNSLNFGRYFLHTHAIELDKGRCTDLETNVKVLKMADKIDVHQGDSIQWIKQIKQHVLFLDPPWGGPGYKATAATVDLFLGDWSMNDLLWNLYEDTKVSSTLQLIALRVPFEYNHSKLALQMVRIPPLLVSELRSILSEPTAEGLTAPSEQIEQELQALLKQHALKIPRPHPFKILLEKVVMLLFAFPSLTEREECRQFMLEQARIKVLQRSSASSSSSSSSATTPAATTTPASTAATSSSDASAPSQLEFTLSNLDSLIYMLNAYNVFHVGETDPAFFDWEKERWIATRRWKGCTLEPAKKIHDEARRQQLAAEGTDKKAGQGRRSEKLLKKAQDRKEKFQAKKQAKLERKQQRAEAIAAEGIAVADSEGAENNAVMSGDLAQPSESN